MSMRRNVRDEMSVRRNVRLPLHIFMTNKSEKLYKAVITTVQQLIPTFNPTFAIGDFELAPKNSFTEVFPHITIIGCWFHYTKAIYDKVKKVGLSKLYKRNQNFRAYIRKLMGLPLLPEEDILPVFLSLEIPSVDLLYPEKEMIRRFRMYFTKTWMNGHCSFSVLYHKNATNNGAESYHKTINTYIKVSHPNIWNFMLYLNNIISDFDFELQRLKEGHATTRGSNSVTNAKRDRRNECKQQLLNGFLCPIEYHNAVSLTIGRDDYNLGTVQPPIPDILKIYQVIQMKMWINPNIAMFVNSIGVKTLHFYTMILFIVDFAKHVQIVCGR